MDWIFTDTALGLSSWLQLEDIYSNVYLLKCYRWVEKVKVKMIITKENLSSQKYPTERGVTRPKITKYGVGGSLLALLILLIWFPLLFFSFSSSFYQPNPPKEVNVEIKLGGYLVIRFLVCFPAHYFISLADLSNDCTRYRSKRIQVRRLETFT